MRAAVEEMIAASEAGAPGPRSASPWTPPGWRADRAAASTGRTRRRTSGWSRTHRSGCPPVTAPPPAGSARSRTRAACWRPRSTSARGCSAAGWWWTTSPRCTGCSTGWTRWPASPPEPSTYRFDQAELALGVPAAGCGTGSRPRRRPPPAGGWTTGPATCCPPRCASGGPRSSPPPGADAGALVARLLDRLVELDARVLFVATTGHAVDRTVGLLCDRLARSGRLRSGLVQRVGPLVARARCATGGDRTWTRW